MTEFIHLHPAIVSVASSDKSTRIAWIKKSRWIGYPRAQEVLSKLDDILHHPREARMPNMLLIGKSNNGKTRLIQNFVQRHPADDNPNGEHIIAKVMYIQAPPVPSETALYYEILRNLFVSVPSSSVDARRSRAVQILRDIQLKVLVIDELHNILAGTTVKQQSMLNVLKYLGNELQISIVGCGTSDLLRAVSIDPQIQNRFTPEIIPEWILNKEFKQLLKSFEVVLPLRKPSNLIEAKIASKILAMTDGLIGEVSGLLNVAAIYAINHDIEYITMDVLNKCGYIPPSNRTSYASRI